MILILISEIGLAAEIFVQQGNSIQNAVNNSSPGDIIIVKPGTYTENIKISKENLTLRSEARNPEDTIIRAKNSSDNVLLLRGSKIKIEGFMISGATKYGCSGVLLYSCNNCTIDNNKLVNNSFGSYLLSSKENTISKNTFFNNYRGIDLKYSTNNTILGNTVINNKEYGITLEGSIENAISRNIASNNERGIYFGTSDSNILSDNVVQENKVYGFFICGKCDKNLIYNNYFNNSNMTITNGVGNAYNFTKKEDANIIGGPYTGGNYWGKPDGKGFSQTAVDSNRDGISDSIYKNITGSRYSDYLPLVDLKPAPIVPATDFSSNITSGDAPLNIAFTDTSTEVPTAWKWSFGDGTYSTEKNPKHTYSTAGNYTITLASTNEAGTGTKTKSNYIKVTQPIQKPVVYFWGSRTSGTEPLTIVFTDNSTNSPTAWNWDFGDGTSSTLQNPRHTYSEAGNYTVTLTTANEAGNAIKTRPNYIKIAPGVQKPVANFNSNISYGDRPLNVAFTDTSTGTPTAWNWSFGDKSTSTVQNPVYTYSAAGSYTVSLTVGNAAGNNTTIKSNYINVTEPVQKPVVNFWGSRVSGYAPLNVTFTDNSTNSPTSWKWSFGDGTYSTEQNPRHTYSAAGNYTVTLSASNIAGEVTKTRPSYVSVMPTLEKPVVHFWSSRVSGYAPLNVTFTDNSTNSPTAWKWNFGDGTYSTLQNPKHTYSAAGNYTITLIASNEAGSGNKTRSDYVKVIKS